MRKSRPSTPPMVTGVQPMKGSTSDPRSRPSTSSSKARDCGPATANCAHCSVTEIRRTSQSGRSTWAANSRWPITSPAAAVVVVIR